MIADRYSTAMRLDDEFSYITYGMAVLTNVHTIGYVNSEPPKAVPPCQIQGLITAHRCAGAPNARPYRRHRHPGEVSERPISWITPGKARGEAIPHIYQPRRGVSCGHDGTAEGRFNIHTAYGLGVPAERPYHRYDTKIPPHNRIAVE